MVNPKDVNLIIFDLDGTIVMSQPLVYEATKRAFAKLGWPVTFEKEEINRFIGVSVASTTGSFYEFITPPHSHLTPDEVRELVRAEYPAIFHDKAMSFPGVKETLTALRQRGYKLAQYTNASTQYLNTVMSSLELRDCYDYVECIEDNHLTKNELAAKIKKHFGLEAAIVGDRCHDTEAARENGCLAIGALYGYGEKEPEAADLTIKQFSDLLTIFDRRLPIFEQIAIDIQAKKQRNQPFIIGINGIDCSGKTTFAKALGSYLKSKGHPTQMIAIDDFLYPKAIRYAGTDQADNYYNKSFNIELLIDNLLKAAREKGRVSAELTSLTVETDKFDRVNSYTIKPETIVILEGVFLFRKELAPFFDYKVYLDIPFRESKQRAQIRDSKVGFSKYDEKYLPGQARYIQQYNPATQANMVIENSNIEYPKFKPGIS
jgi:phosphoglycolate phosphatase-like HAD superfamily hydrolase/uridine kinase